MLRPAFFKLASAVALTVLLASTMVEGGTAPALEYDKSAEVNIKGVIDDVKTAADHIIHLTLKDGNDSLDLFVAPEKFLKEMEIIFAKGETIEVLGSQRTVDGEVILLVREVRRSGDVMTIRDEEGKPVWVGWIE